MLFAYSKQFIPLNFECVWVYVCVCCMFPFLKLFDEAIKFHLKNTVEYSRVQKSKVK